MKKILSVLLVLFFVMGVASNVRAEETNMPDPNAVGVPGPSLLASAHAAALKRIQEQLKTLGMQLERTAAAGVADHQQDRDNFDEGVNAGLVERNENTLDHQSGELHLARAMTMGRGAEAFEAGGMMTNAVHLSGNIASAILGPFAQTLFTSSRANGALGNLTMILTAACKIGAVTQDQARSLGSITHQGCQSNERISCALFGGATCLKKNGRINISARGGGAALNYNSIKNLVAESGVAKNPSRLFAFSIAGGGGGGDLDTKAAGLAIAMRGYAPDMPLNKRGEATTGTQEFVASGIGAQMLGDAVSSFVASAGPDIAPSVQDLRVGDLFLYQHNGKQLARLIAGGGQQYDGGADACAEKGYSDLKKDLSEGFVSARHVRTCAGQVAMRGGENAQANSNGAHGEAVMASAMNTQMNSQAGLDTYAAAPVVPGAQQTGTMVSLLKSKEFKEFVDSGEFAKLAAVYWDKLDSVWSEASQIAQANVEKLNIKPFIPSFYAGNYIENEERYFAALDQDRKKMSLNDYFIEFDSDTAMNLPTPDVIRYAGVLNLFQNKYLYNSDGETLIASIEDKPSITVAQSQTTWDMVFGKTGSQLLAEFKQKGEPVDADTVVSEKGTAPAPKATIVSKLEQPAPAHAFKAMPIAALIRY